MAIYRLYEGMYVFPPVEEAEEDGLLAIGGDLSPGRLVEAYSRGIFPWYNEGEPILWWCPRERFVILPSHIHVSSSMKKFMKKTEWTVTINKDFPAVIHQCRKLREDKEGTWITDDMENAYCCMHKLGFADSVEVWDRGELVGGLYGVRLRKCFFGESMFSRKENGSKLALITLARTLEDAGFHMIDCQFHTDHLESMGGQRMSYQEYMELLKKK